MLNLQEDSPHHKYNELALSKTKTKPAQSPEDDDDKKERRKEPKFPTPSKPKSEKDSLEELPV